MREKLPVGTGLAESSGDLVVTLHAGPSGAASPTQAGVHTHTLTHVRRIHRLLAAPLTPASPCGHSPGSPEVMTQDYRRWGAVALVRLGPA